ncbi:MAG: iron transporter permease [Thermoleophilia bacterium]|nr:iron transporter permease [Thermoleophilia bacterium]MCZ4496917.1 iron transporter permease [Thermoleophilia bacterium]
MITRARILVAVLTVVALATCSVALLAGSRWFAPTTAAQVLVESIRGEAASDPVDTAILVKLRLPRVVGMFAVGALLAAAGALLQLVLATPLADPYILGASGGAGVGALLSLWLGLLGGTALAAFAGACVATALTLAIGRAIGGSPVHLLLSGLCVSALTGAAMSVLLLGTAATGHGAAPALAWLLGGVIPSDWSTITAGLTVAALIILGSLLFGRDLDVLTLGEDPARALGVRPNRVLLVVVLATALATGIAVSLAGLIGFIGALVPIATRALLPASARMNVPAAALLGGTSLVLVDALARTVLRPTELPAGVIAACLGAPIVLLVIRGEAVGRARL